MFEHPAQNIGCLLIGDYRVVLVYEQSLGLSDAFLIGKREEVIHVRSLPA